MEVTGARALRRILGVFAHPDDETTAAGGTITRYAREGVDVHVAIATRGEQGTLGTGGVTFKREELPAIREAEARSALNMLGAQPPIFLDYRDGELARVDYQRLVERVEAVMEKIRPDVVITWGPTGISHHDDHIAIHRATVEAFHRYIHSTMATMATNAKPRLYFIALPENTAKQLEMRLHQSEITPTVIVDIAEHKSLKIRALKTYVSQEDAQEIAEMFEAKDFDIEAFHQAHPPTPSGQVSSGFWE